MTTAEHGQSGGAARGSSLALETALAATSDFAACFDVLELSATDGGFNAILCRHFIEGQGQADSFERHTLDGAASGLLAEGGFRRAWPVESYALGRSRPFCWTTSEWPGEQGAMARHAMARLAAAGVEGGVSMSVRGPIQRATLVTGFCSVSGLSAFAGDGLDRWQVAVSRFHARLCEVLSPQARVPDLSRREREILQLTASGLTAVAVARELGVAEATVKFHLAGIRKKLGVSKTSGAVAKFQALIGILS
jgi:DNA-binding CsgD family transcriptional regulator